MPISSHIVIEDGQEYVMTTRAFGIDYRQNGKFHRICGPARTFSDGSEEWHYRGQLHCTSGPAIRNGSGHTEYWINGIHLSLELYNEYTVDIKQDIKNSIKIEPELTRFSKILNNK
jgi:hypothetical protein